jgi:hypothetical protein
MNTETRLLPGGEYGSTNGSGEPTSSLRDQIEAEKRAKIEELLAPYRAKRAEMQTQRDEFERALGGLDRDLAELDSVIGQVEASVGLVSPSRKKKKGSASSSSSARAKEGKAAVNDDWVIQKLREQPRGAMELGKAAKEEGYKASGLRAVIERLLEANVVRVNGDGGYEMV